MNMSWSTPTLYQYTDCAPYDSNRDTLINTIITFSIGIWLPMIMIVVVNILMYIKIRKQATKRKLSSSHNSSAQMVQISRTFMIVVVVYFVCYLPHTILHTMYDSFHNATEFISNTAFNKANRVFNRALPFTNFLLFSNSCLNPIIYSKIHKKIYDWIKVAMIRCKKRFSCIWNWCKQVAEQQTSVPEANNIEIFAIPSVENEYRVKSSNPQNGNSTEH